MGLASKVETTQHRLYVAELTDFVYDLCTPFTTHLTRLVRMDTLTILRWPRFRLRVEPWATEHRQLEVLVYRTLVSSSSSMGRLVFCLMVDRVP